MHTHFAPGDHRPPPRCWRPNRPVFGVFLLALLLAGSAAADINVRTNPVYVIASAVNLEMDIGVGERWTLGPAVVVDAMLEDYIVGMRINRYRQPRDANGWYTGLATRYSPNGVATGDELYSVRLLEHYQWQWDNFNLALGIGPDLRHEGGEWALWAGTDLSLGWRF